MEDLKQMSAVTALNDMMESGRFDICCIRNVAELLGVNPKESEAFAILQPLHCVRFEKMPPQLREAIPSLVEKCLGVSPIYKFKSVQPAGLIEVITPEESKKKSVLRLMFGG